MYSSILIFGEALWDCFPDGKQILGGAPFNVAWHLRAWGQNPLFISRVGQDSAGDEIQHRVQTWGLNPIAIQTDLKHPTGQVTVSFAKDEPQYLIRENCAYDFIETSALPQLQSHSLLYHGTLALRHPIARKTLQYIKQTYNPKLFLDVNLRSPYWNLLTVTSLLSETTWLKLNEQELTLITPQGDTIAQRANWLMEHYPLESVTVTQGAMGATLFQSKELPLSIQPDQSSPVVDTVGAGDAFSSILLLGLLKEWHPEQTLARAQQFASAIVGQQGAVSTDPAFYQSFLDHWV